MQQHGCKYFARNPPPTRPPTPPPPDPGSKHFAEHRHYPGDTRPEFKMLGGASKSVFV